MIIPPFIRKWKRLLVVGGIFFIVVLLLFTPWVSDLLTLPLNASETLAHVDALIVLGGGTQRGDNPLPLQARLRVEHGAELALTLNVPIIVSGGFSKTTGLYEAPLLADEALTQGMDADNIVLESASRNTYENATKSLAIVREHGWESIGVVTSDYHTWRACRIFRKQMKNTTCIAAPSRDPSTDTIVDRLWRFRGVVREYGAILLFAVKGYL